MKKGFIASAFDLLHPGHLYTLKTCSDYCDWLVVGLHVDPSIERKGKKKPAESVYERYVRLKACKWVDRIIPYETEKDLRNILETCNFDVRFLGEDYMNREKEITGLDIVKIKYIPRNHSWSTSELRERMKK